MDRLESIVVAVDFSECSASALAQAARMARDTGATLHVLHVLESLVMTDAMAGIATSEEALRALVVSETEKKLRSLLPDAERPENLQVDVRVGSPIADVLDKVREVSADLLVLGAQGACGTRKRLGRMARDCVRKAPTKVIVVRRSHAGPFRDVLACVDLSDNSWRAVREAVRVAKRDRSRLHLLHVYDPPWHHVHYRSPTPEISPSFKKQYKDLLRVRLEGFLEPFAEDTTGLDVGCELFPDSDFGAGIREYIRRTEVDLAVLGTRGRSLRSMLFGSTTERVMKKMPCSVLAIKPTGPEAAEELLTATPASSLTSSSTREARCRGDRQRPSTR